MKQKQTGQNGQSVFVSYPFLSVTIDVLFLIVAEGVIGRIAAILIYHLQCCRNIKQKALRIKPQGWISDVM